MYRTDFWTLCEKARVGCFKRTASKHVYYLGWKRSPAQVGCMRQVLGPGALGRPRGIGWRGGWEGELGWGIHVYPWLIHVSVWQKPLQYCKVISLQLIKKKIKITIICERNKDEGWKSDLSKYTSCHRFDFRILSVFYIQYEIKFKKQFLKLKTKLNKWTCLSRSGMITQTGTISGKLKRI